MKLTTFLESYEKSGIDNTYLKSYEEVGTTALVKLPGLSILFEEFSGAVFDDGLFKIHNKGSFYLWTELTFEYFKKFKGNSYCFAFDWVGRQYAVNYINNRPRILMLDPATAEAFELEKNIELFFNEDLVEYKKEMLEFDKFKHLKKKLNSKLKFEECFGFKKMLFLGGKDDLENYELIDLEVYWELNYQIYTKTKDLPGGTLIDNINIE